MLIKLPRIDGTKYDKSLNEMIDSVNREISPHQPKLAAHVIAAIGKFLLEKHEVKSGSDWIAKSLPLVESIPINSSMVDNLYEQIVEQTERSRGKGCGLTAIIIIVAPIVVGIIWWRFVSIEVIPSLIVGISTLILIPSAIQFISAWSLKGRKFVGQVIQRIQLQLLSRRISLPILISIALFLLPFSLAADKLEIIIVVVCIWFSVMLRWITPPTILLLGVSGTQSNELLPLLNTALHPAITVHLLTEDYENPKKGADLKLETMITNSRTLGSVKWEKVVEAYLQLCDVILVDLRTSSANLRVELSIIGASPLEIKDKIIYLITEGETANVLLFDVDYEKKLCKNVDDALQRLQQKI